MYRQGRQTCPEGREELTGSGSWGCRAEPPPSRTPAQEQHPVGSAGLTPLYIQREGRGLPACGRSRNQSTCVPLPCHRKSGQKARSQVRGMHRAQGAPPPQAEAGAQCCPCPGADPDEAAPASPPFPRRGNQSCPELSGVKAPAPQPLGLPRKESPAPQAAQQHQSLQQLPAIERVGLDPTGALSLPREGWWPQQVQASPSYLSMSPPSLSLK